MIKEFIQDLKDGNILTWFTLITIVLCCFLIIWKPSPNAVSIPDTVTKTDKIENHELAGSYRIDCLDGREVMTLYNSGFTQADFIYTGKCE